MKGVRRNRGHADATGFRPANAIGKVVVVVVVVVVLVLVLVRGLGVVMVGIFLSGMVLMDKAQALEQPMR
ncbi:MAG: hypothetical protein RIS24_2043 [Verrucomicrobiota bacterium]|jgi:hypothetical protein